MANTYTLISSNTVGSGGATQVDFNSIPQTYTDLLIKTSTNASSLTVLRIRFNSVSSNDYTQIVLRGTGSATARFTDTGWDSLAYLSPSYNNDGANIFSNNEYYIPSYTSSNIKFLSGNSVSEANATTAYQIMYDGILNNTSAITSISFTAASGSFAQYSTFYLYGIKNS
jgi:hypothetical protein